MLPYILDVAVKTWDKVSCWESFHIQVSVEMDMSKPDLAAALKDIRAQYENLSARNQAQAEEWYRSKFASVTEVASRNQDAMKHSKEELSEYRRQVQARTLEIEALRGHNEALERQIAEMEDRHNSELGDMQVSHWCNKGIVLFSFTAFNKLKSTTDDLMSKMVSLLVQC